VSAAGARVVCVGVSVVDAIFDVPVLPSGPEKVHASGYREVAGGVAANAARAVARLGGRACLLSRVGADRLAELLIDEFAADGIDVSGVVRRKGCRTPFSMVAIDGGGERQIVNDTDLRLFQGAARIDRQALAEADAVLVDTRWPAAALVALRSAKRRGVPGVIDVDIEPDDAVVALIRTASHAVFSRQGLRGLTGEDGIERGLALARRFTSAWVAVTAGAAGVFWSEAEGSAPRQLPAFPVKAVDTLAAGDVFHGALALALAEGRPLQPALRFAMAAAALKCTRPGGGAGTPYRHEVESFLAERAG
jgi:sulfofructose kinase